MHTSDNYKNSVPTVSVQKPRYARKRRTGKRLLTQMLGAVAGSFAISWCLPGGAIAQSVSGASSSSYLDTIDQLNIFGDSVSDAGNVFTLSQGTFPPSPPYAQRLSNGPVWVETIAAELGLSPELSTNVVPSIVAGVAAPPADGINYALAGSLSSDVNVGGPPFPGLQQQIATFSALSQAGIAPSSNALNILLAGGNDYNEAILTATSAADLAGLAEQVTTNIVGATSALFNAGAKHVLVSNLPTLGLQPFADSVDEFNPQGSSILSALSSEHNQLLEQKLAALDGTLDASSATLTQFDLSSITDEIVADPSAFGLENAQDTCLTDFQIDNTFTGICADPDKFFFWDDVHPTTVGHTLIAQSALETLANAGGKDPVVPPDDDAAAVPEPSSVLALLLLGGGLGLSTRRQRA